MHPGTGHSFVGLFSRFERADSVVCLGDRLVLRDLPESQKSSPSRGVESHKLCKKSSRIAVTISAKIVTEMCGADLFFELIKTVIFVI